MYLLHRDPPLLVTPDGHQWDLLKLVHFRETPSRPQECWHLVAIDACTHPFRNGKMLSSKQVTRGAKRKVNKYFRHRYMEMIYDFQITFYISLICFLCFIKIIWVFHSETIQFSLNDFSEFSDKKGSNEKDLIGWPLVTSEHLTSKPPSHRWQTTPLTWAQSTPTNFGQNCWIH